MRRQFRLTGLVAVAIVVGAMILASCSTTPSSPTNSGTAASSSKPYGSLTIGITFESGNFDPQIGSGNSSSALAAAVFDSLGEVDPNGKVRPGLAERWEISSDGKTHTFYIRKGVKFHNGDDLTGSDVKFSIERMLDPKASHQDAGVLRGQIDSVEMKDDYTIVLRLKQPQFELLKGFGDDSGGSAVVPKKYIEEKGVDYFRSHPVGSGPWKVLNYTTMTRVDLEAVEDHWRTVPKFKNITLLHILEEATKVAMLKTGELDAAIVAPDSVPQLKAAGLRIVSHDGSSQSFMWPFWDMQNPQKYALSDVKVRKALSLAINRKELADKVYGGYAEPSALMYAPATAFFFDPNVLKPDPFDPEQVNKLLAEAGYPSGFSTAIQDVGGGGVLSTYNQAIAGYWRKVGVKTDIIPIDYAVATKKWNPISPDIFNTVFSYFSSSPVFNFEKMYTPYHSKKGAPKNINNPRLDELIDKVPLTADPVEKKRLALEAAVLAKNEYTTLSVLDLRTVFAIDSKIGELIPIKGMAGLAPALETITHAK
ncbi:MAG: ABC transporter substrate-binding protein [Dehalococcoidia bacterium]|nr:ABC transporter substrate-binding protein [Dehalococcoidia bacterium]